MRKFIKIVEEANDLNWIDNLPLACTVAQAGFHFEEGGCWGMALALYDTFEGMGYSPRLLVNTTYWHAVVEVNGIAFDHSGRTTAVGTEMSPDEIYTLGHSVDREQIDQDKEWAREIIHNAMTLNWDNYDVGTHRWIGPAE